MTKNKKKYYIILGILGIYFLIMLVVFIIPGILNKQRETYLLIGNEAKWQYKDETWEDLEDKKEYNWKKFAVYEDNIFLGNYYALLSETWHFYDNKNKPVKLDSPNFLAIRSNGKYNVANFEEREITEEEMKYVEEVLKDNNITTTKFTASNIFNYDLDNDKKEEKVFTISNIFTEEFTEKIFNFIFVVKDDKITVVSKTIDDFPNMYNNCKMYVDKVIDVNGDNKYEIITGCEYYSVMGNCLEMYEYSNNQYHKIKSCN